MPTYAMSYSDVGYQSKKDHKHAEKRKRVEAARRATWEWGK